MPRDQVLGGEHVSRVASPLLDFAFTANLSLSKKLIVEDSAEIFANEEPGLRCETKLASP